MQMRDSICDVKLLKYSRRGSGIVVFKMQISILLTTDDYYSSKLNIVFRYVIAFTEFNMLILDNHKRLYKNEQIEIEIEKYSFFL